MFFGRIAENKGLDILAEAYRKVYDELDNSVSLSVIGNGDFSLYEKLYRHLSNVTIINRWIEDREVESIFLGHNSMNYFFLGTNLISWNQSALIIHIQKRTNIQHCAKKSACFGNTASSDVEGQICGKKPMMQIQFMRLCPLINLFYGFALIPQICQAIHKKSVSGGCPR